MKIILIICYFILQPLVSFALPVDNVPSTPWTDQWRKEGQLVSVQVSRGNPIRIFIVGREEAKIDPNSMTVTVRRLKPYPAKTLSLDKFNDYFVVSDVQEFKKSKEIEITTKVKGSEETFRFDMKQDIP